MSPSLITLSERAAVAVLGLSLTVLGCRLLGPEVGESDICLRIEVDQTYYSVEADSLVRVRLLNEGPRPVYTRTPLPYIVLERRAEGRWEELPLWYGWTLGPQPVWDVAPGDSIMNAVTVGDEVFTTSGRYRFRYQLFFDGELKRSLPLARRISTDFVIGQ